MSGKTTEERFWENVQKTETCWLWTGAPNKQGYGQLYVNGKGMYAHRLSYQIRHGSIPEGLDILHTCDRPGCVRPDHLRAGTHQDNMKDRDEKGRGNAPKGVDKGNAKLTEAQVKEIRKAYKFGSTQVALSQKYAISQVQVSNIINQKSWKHV